VLLYKHKLAKRANEMATRSSIGYLKADGSVVAIYSHWDGYPAGVGKTLQENYQAAYKIGKLVQMGDVSSLGAEIGEKQDFNDRSTQKDEWTLFYGRDRGETGVDCREFESIAAWIEGLGQEYNYLWTGKQWIVNDHEATDSIGNYVFDFLDLVVNQEVARLQAAGYDI
jgi:hypothetical protein